MPEPIFATLNPGSIHSGECDLFVDGTDDHGNKVQLMITGRDVLAFRSRLVALDLGKISDTYYRLHPQEASHKCAFCLKPAPLDDDGTSLGERACEEGWEPYFHYANPGEVLEDGKPCQEAGPVCPECSVKFIHCPDHAEPALKPGLTVAKVGGVLVVGVN